MMKRLLAITLGLLTSACMTGTPDRAPGTESSATESVTFEAVPASCSGGDTCAGTPEATCLGNCRARHEACLERALGDPTSECLCDNASRACVRACGQPSGPPQICPT
jgi:hypothetical protein